MPHLKSSTIKVRLDKLDKSESFAVFEKNGITPAHAIREFFRYIRENKKFPFSIENAASTDKQ